MALSAGRLRRRRRGCWTLEPLRIFSCEGDISLFATGHFSKVDLLKTCGVRSGIWDGGWMARALPPSITSIKWIAGGAARVMASFFPPSP